MKIMGKSHQERFVLKKTLSAIIWLLVPTITQLGFGSSLGRALFRTQPYNISYDAMFIAATVGIGLTSMWGLLSYQNTLRNESARDLPVFFSWWNAFDLFEVLASLNLGILFFVSGVPGSGIAWLLSFVILIISTLRLSQAEKDVVIEKPAPHTNLSRVASAFFLIIAILFVAFPVLQPWYGPPEPFVRWYPFSPAGELVWRGIFLSFSFGMMMTALDPFGRHRPFLIALVLSGYLHSGEMAVDHLLSVQMVGMNANPEHLYGDILGWFVIASVSLLFLLLSRKNAPQPQPKGI